MSSVIRVSVSSLLLLAAMLICLATRTLAANSVEVTKDANELEPMGGPRGALTRFLFYNSRPTERQATASGALGYKRSSSALDALTGVTLGKRAAPVELVNFEPVFGRQYTMRSVPRMYDLRWAPLDSFRSDGPAFDVDMS